MDTGTRRTWTWETIEQPGDYFEIRGDTLREDTGDGYRVWRILHDVPGGLYCTLVTGA